MITIQQMIIVSLTGGWVLSTITVASIKYAEVWEQTKKKPGISSVRFWFRWLFLPVLFIVFVFVGIKGKAPVKMILSELYKNLTLSFSQDKTT